jgi:hypothetical protein
MQHLAMDKTEPAKKVLHLGLVARDQGEDGLDSMVFGRVRELPDELLSYSLAAICWINADYFDPCHRPGEAKLKFTGAPQHKPNDAIVDFGNQRGPVGPNGLGDLNSLLPLLRPRHSCLALLQADDRR